jgi:hypothetical protein
VCRVLLHHVPRVAARLLMWRSHHTTSHRIASHRIASHRIASHRIASHLVTLRALDRWQVDIELAKDVVKGLDNDDPMKKQLWLTLTRHVVEEKQDVKGYVAPRCAVVFPALTERVPCVQRPRAAA